MLSVVQASNFILISRMPWDTPPLASPRALPGEPVRRISILMAYIAVPSFPPVPTRRLSRCEGANRAPSVAYHTEQPIESSGEAEPMSVRTADHESRCHAKPSGAPPGPLRLAAVHSAPQFSSFCLRARRC
ncbi:hypothetical protein WOLCODRAFT_140804 [Wolfiporia cocos MD-104 SS10]|uniref:Uncharacterized protein n=1 Tax=Wolfiporia cocos (strain MD-104) TaxID=742152 RepID=A0A2H3JMT9_WOLCO|nr:hypothetical protein WOLCODRAFT_140804 [Wolfiporia cocos MD-104 SS10]